MKINDIYNILNEYAPIELSNAFTSAINGFDNSGIIASVSEDIKGVVFSLDLTLSAVDMAIKNDCNLIVTHHPAIYKPISCLNEGDALLKALNNKIGVISFHLNLDVAKEGIDYYLAKGLGAKDQEILIPLGEKVGYGRKFNVDSTIEEIAQNYKKEFSTNNVMIYGNLKEKVTKMATFCGAGLDESEIELSKDSDLLLSADIKHHVILKALSLGKKVIEVTHYSSEFYGFNKFYEVIKDKLNVKCLINKEEVFM